MLNVSVSVENGRRRISIRSSRVRTPAPRVHMGYSAFVVEAQWNRLICSVAEEQKYKIDFRMFTILVVVDRSRV